MKKKKKLEIFLLMNLKRANIIKENRKNLN